MVRDYPSGHYDPGVDPPVISLGDTEEQLVKMMLVVGGKLVDDLIELLLKHLLIHGKPSFDHWEFVTARSGELADIAKFFGLYYQNSDDGQIVHSLVTAIISLDGKLYKWYHGSNWTAAEIVKDLENSLATASPRAASNHKRD